jgi:LysR family transcriptional activator of nhaA
VAKEVCRQYNVVLLGAAADIKERFFAITAERKLQHPAVRAVSEAARNELFGNHC